MQNTTEELTLEAAKKIIQDLQAKLARREPKPDSIGVQIRKRRISAGISTGDLIKIGVKGISHIERNGKAITTKTLKRIADKVGCPAWQIVKDWEEQSACELASSGQDVSDAKPNLP